MGSSLDLSALKTWLGVVAGVVGLLGMGGLGGVYYYAGQQQVRDSIVRSDIREMQQSLDRLEEGQGQIKEDLGDVSRVACEAQGFTFADCPL